MEAPTMEDTPVAMTVNNPICRISFGFNPIGDSF